jgi:hypothetical protein
MLKFSQSASLFLLLGVLFSEQAIAQTTSTIALPGEQELQQALCQQDWDRASQMIGKLYQSENLSPADRTQLFLLGITLKEFAVGQTKMAVIPGCESSPQAANGVSLTAESKVTTKEKNIKILPLSSDTNASSRHICTNRIASSLKTCESLW